MSLSFPDDVLVGGQLRCNMLSAPQWTFNGPVKTPTFAGGPQGIFPLTADPSVFPGYQAAVGSLAILMVSPFGLFQKVGAPATSWAAFAASGAPGPVIATTLTLQGSITPIVTGTINDWDPAGGGAVSRWRANATGNAVITGVLTGAANVDGRLVFIDNINGTNSISFTHEDAGSLAANRISTPDGQTWVLPPFAKALFEYDGTSARWRPMFATNVLPATTILGALLQTGGSVVMGAGHNVTIGDATSPTTELTGIDMSIADSTGGIIGINGGAIIASSASGANISIVAAKDLDLQTTTGDMNATIAGSIDEVAQGTTFIEGVGGATLSCPASLATVNGGQVAIVGGAGGASMTATAAVSMAGSTATVTANTGTALLTASAGAANVIGATTAELLGQAGTVTITASGATHDVNITAARNAAVTGTAGTVEITAGTHFDLLGTTDSSVQVGTGILELLGTNGMLVIPTKAAQLENGIAVATTITPAALAAASTTQNYAPAGLATCGRIIQAVSGLSSADIGGLLATGIVNGQQIVIVATGNQLVFGHQDAGSTAANRFTNPAGVAYTLVVNGSVTVQYDTAIPGWRILGSVA